MFAVMLFTAQLECVVEAEDPAPAPAPSAKRLVTECMTRKMSASRTLSYNEASRLCKAQIKAQKKDESASNAAPKSMGVR
jgi:hypothetical protein